jgi:hypothetical protein
MDWIAFTIVPLTLALLLWPHLRRQQLRARISKQEFRRRRGLR